MLVLNCCSAVALALGSCYVLLLLCRYGGAVVYADVMPLCCCCPMPLLLPLLPMLLQLLLLLLLQLLLLLPLLLLLL